MSLINNIQNALNTKLSSLSGSPSIAWPNTKFQPTNATSYLRPTLIPATSDLFTINNENRHKGIYQVDIFVQPEKGTSTLWLLADSIRDHFKGVTSLTSGGDIIHLQEISISQAQRVEGWWSCYVQVNYICFN